eukprot:7758405-Karenia_brevis.AAC.1
MTCKRVRGTLLRNALLRLPVTTSTTVGGVQRSCTNGSLTFLGKIHDMKKSITSFNSSSRCPQAR